MGGCQGAEHQAFLRQEDSGALLLPTTRGCGAVLFNQGTGSCLDGVFQ